MIGHNPVKSLRIPIFWISLKILTFVDSLSGNALIRLISTSKGQIQVFSVSVFFLLYVLLKFPGFYLLKFQGLDGFPREEGYDYYGVY